MSTESQIETPSPEADPQVRQSRPSIAQQLRRGLLHPLSTLAYGFALGAIPWLIQIHKRDVLISYLMARLAQ